MALLRRAGTVGLWTLASRVLGLLRDRLLAGAYGAAALDPFLVAFTLPNLARGLFGEGALSTAFVPRYARLRAQDTPLAERFAGRVIARLTFTLTLLTAVLCCVAVLVMRHGPERHARVAELALPQLPYLVLICVVALLAGVLNARGRYGVAAATPVILNVAMIVTALCFAQVDALPYAVLLTGFASLGLSWYELRRRGGVPPLDLGQDAHTRELRAALGPSLFAAGVYQVNALVDTLLAYLLLSHDGDGGSGAVAILYFGNRLLQFPLAMVAHAVGTAMAADLAVAAQSGYAASARALAPAKKLLLLLELPAAVGLAAAADPIVRAIYQTGNFGEAQAQRTIMVVLMFAIALPAVSINKVQVRVFHAHLDQRTPMLISVAMVGLNLACNLCLVLLTPMAEAGLALGTAISAWAGLAISSAVLHRRGAVLGLARADWLWPLLASAVMGLVVWAFTAWLWPSQPGHGTTFHIARAFAAVMLGGGLYAAMMGRQAWRSLRPSQIPAPRIIGASHADQTPQR